MTTFYALFVDHLLVQQQHLSCSQCQVLVALTADLADVVEKEYRPVSKALLARAGGRRLAVLVEREIEVVRGGLVVFYKRRVGPVRRIGSFITTTLDQKYALMGNGLQEIRISELRLQHPRPSLAAARGEQLPRAGGRAESGWRRGPALHGDEASTQLARR